MVSVRGSRSRGALLVRLVAPGAGGDLVRELGGAAGAARVGRRAPRAARRRSRRRRRRRRASTGRWAPIASASRSTWTTRAAGAMSAPWRVVHWFSAAPNATTTSASREQPGGERRREAAGDAERVRVAARTARWRPREVASSAPMRSPSRAQRRPGAGQHGAAAGDDRRPLAPRAGSRPRACDGRARPGAARRERRGRRGGTASASQSAACTSSGSISTTARRSTRRAPHRARDVGHRGRPARARARRRRRPTRTSASWSIRKFDRSAAAGVSAASTSTGVRLLAASVSPVIVFVRPGPWCTLQAASRPLTRA